MTKSSSDLEIESSEKHPPDGVSREDLLSAAVGYIASDASRSSQEYIDRANTRQDGE